MCVCVCVYICLCVWGAGSLMRLVLCKDVQAGEGDGSKCRDETNSMQNLYRKGSHYKMLGMISWHKIGYAQFVTCNKSVFEFTFFLKTYLIFLRCCTFFKDNLTKIAEFLVFSCP